MTQQDKDKVIMVRVTKEMLEQAKQLAKKQDRPVSQIVRELLREKIAKENNK